MAIFQPKVLEEIYANIISSIISGTPITDTTVTSVLSRIAEAMALEIDELYFQMFTIIQNSNLETTTGDDLETRAAEFGLTREAATYSSGTITLGDTSISKIDTNIFNGLPGPIIGDTTLYTDKTTAFDTSGSLIVGRGTSNVETLVYSSVDNSSADYTKFILTTAFTNDHGTEETVIMSQGGNRVVSAGTVVKVPADDISPEITFTLSSIATILDGEEEIEDITVTATDAGESSNVPAGAIREFSSPPFSTATVINVNQFTNGGDEESDQELRDRIRSYIQALSRGTVRALELESVGVEDPDTNQRVTSSQVVEPTVPGAPNILYIDDGNPSGFTPTQDGQGIETVLTSAAEGDKFLQLDFFPLVPEIVIDSSNNKIDFNEGGGDLVATLTEGVYDVVDLMTEIKTQLESAGALTYTITRNVYQNIRIQASGSFSLLWNTGANAANSAGKTIGYSILTDDSGSNTYDADYQFRRILLQKNSTDLFPGIDYIINPYLGEIELITPLSSGDQITAGDAALKASIECTNAETYSLCPASGLTGTVTFTQGSTAVSAVGGAFETEVGEGDFVKLSGDSGAVIVGTVTFTQGSTVVTKSGGGAFSTQLAVGDFIKLDADNATKFARVATVDGADALTLVAGYTGAGGAGAASKSDPWAKVTSITDDDNLVLEWVYAGAGGAGTGQKSSPETLAVAIDGGNAQVATFVPIDFSTLGSATAEEVRDRLTAHINAAAISASAAGTKVTISSLVNGSDGSVRVSGGDANIVLAFSTTEEVGIDAYKYYTGLLRLVQWTIDGLKSDPDTYPGVKAAGVQVEIRVPSYQQLSLTIDITPVEGVNVLSLIDETKSAVASYVNSLGIGEEVVLSEIVDRIQDIEGIYDVEITSPTANVSVADGELARVNDSDIAVG